MTFDVERLLQLWTDPLPVDDSAAAAAFRQLYADPVTVNGTPMAPADFVARARAVQNAFAPVRREVLSVVDGGDRIAVAFRMGGRQVGTWTTSAGPLPARVVLCRVESRRCKRSALSGVRPGGDRRMRCGGRDRGETRGDVD